MGIFDKKKKELYKGVELDPNVDSALQKQLIDRGQSGSIQNLAPEKTPNMVQEMVNPQVLKDTGKALVNLPSQLVKDTAKATGMLSDVVLEQPAVLNALESTVGQFTKVDDAFTGNLKRDDGSTIGIDELSMPEMALGVGGHYLKKIGQGAMSTAVSTLHGFEWLGADSLKPISQKLDDWNKAADPGANFGFADNLASGLGSLGMFFIPGIGASKIASALGTYSPRILSLLGGTEKVANAGMTAFEALSEAGDAWKTALDAGKSESEANKIATGVFTANAILIGLTNKYFDTANKGLKKLLMTSVGEGSQEFGQQILQNLASGRKWDEGAYEAAAVGALLGGAFGLSEVPIANMKIETKETAGTGEGVGGGGGGTLKEPIAVPEEFYRVETAEGEKYFETNEDATSYAEANLPSGSYIITQQDSTAASSVIANSNKDYFPFETGLSKQQTIINQAVDEIQLKTGSTRSEAVQMFNAWRDLIDKQTKADESQATIFKEAVDQAKLNIGETPSIVEEAIAIASKNVVPASAKEQTSTIYHRTNNDADMIRNEGFIPGKNSVFGKAAFFGRESNPLYGVNEITEDIRSYNLKSLPTVKEQQEYIAKQGVANLSEAIQKEGKYDGFIIPNKNTGDVIGITNNAKLNKNLFRQQVLTDKQAAEQSKSFPFLEQLGIPVVARKNLKTWYGKDIWGKYSKGMIEFLSNPHKSTIPHEAVHAFMDLMMTPEQKQKVIDEAKRRFAGKIIDAKKEGRYKNAIVAGLSDDDIAEEILAEDMINYVKTGKAASNKLKQFYNWFWNGIKKLVGKDNRDIIEGFYADIQKSPSFLAKRKAIRKATGYGTMSELHKEFLQDPEALTSKILKNVDIAKRDVSSYAYLTQVMASLDPKKGKGIKQIEWDLVNEILQSKQFKDNPKINMADFRAAIMAELMPIEVIETDKWAEYGVESGDRTISNALSENIDYSKSYVLNTPFNHGYIGNHWHVIYDAKKNIAETADDFKIVTVTKEQAATQGQNINSDKYIVVDKEFEAVEGMTEEQAAAAQHHVANTMEAAQSWIDNYVTNYKNRDIQAIRKKTKWSKGQLSHFRISYMKDGSALVTEIQSDTFQNKTKEELTMTPQSLIEDKKREIVENEKVLKREESLRLSGLRALGIEEGGELEDSVTSIHDRTIKDIKSDIEELNKDLIRLQSGDLTAEEKNQIKLSKLFTSYYQNWYEVTIKQAIRVAAMNGATSISFPDGFTANMIEDWSGQSSDIQRADVNNEDIYVGNSIDIYGEPYTITSVNGDGSYSAVYGESPDHFSDDDVNKMIREGYAEDHEIFADDLNQEIFDDWDNIRDTKIEKLRNLVSYKEEMVVKDTDKINDINENLKKAQDGTLRVDIEDVFKLANIPLFNAGYTYGGGKYFYSSDINPALLKDILKYLDSNGIAYNFAPGITGSEIVKFSEEILESATSLPLFYFSPESLERYIERQKSSIEQLERDIKWNKETIDRNKKSISNIEEIDRSIKEEEGEAELIDIVENSDIFQDEIDNYIDQKVDSEDNFDYLEEAYGRNRVFSYEDRGDTEYLVFDEETQERYFDAPEENEEDADKIIEMREEFETETNYTFPDVEILKSVNGQTGRTIETVYGKSETTIKAWTPEEKKTYKAEYTQRIKDALTKAKEENPANEGEEVSIYPIRMVFPGIDAKYQTAAQRYEGAIQEFVNKYRGKENVENIVDEYGYRWYETAIDPSDRAAIEVFQTGKKVKDPQIYKGKAVASYFEDLEISKGQEEDEIDDYVKEIISKQDFTLQSVKISDILYRDKNVRDYVMSGENRYQVEEGGQPIQEDIDQPIIVGNWNDGDYGVLDGYNRILTKKQQGDTYIQAYVAEPNYSATSAKQLESRIRGGFMWDKEALKELGISTVGATHGMAEGYMIDGKPAVAMSWSEGALAGFAIHPNFQGKGLASIMIAKMAADSPLPVYDPNERMMSVLTKLGNVSEPDGRGVVTLTLKPDVKYQVGRRINPDAPEDQSIKFNDPARYAKLEERRSELQKELGNQEAQVENDIFSARYTDLSYTDEDKESGYQFFKVLVSRRPWILDPETDDLVLKSRIKDINLDNKMFEGAKDVTNDELLEEFKTRYYQEKEMAAFAKQMTPTEVAQREKLTSQKIVKKATKKDKLTIRKILAIVKGEENPNIITDKESSILNAKLKAMASSAKAGMIFGREDMRALLLNKFASQRERDARKAELKMLRAGIQQRSKYETRIGAMEKNAADLKAIKKAIAAYAQQLPPSIRGSLLTTVANAKTELDMAKAFAKIDAALKASDNKNQLERIKKMSTKVKKAMKTGTGIAVDYQKKIADILNSYNLVNPTKSTIDKLNSLSEYIATHPDANIPDHLVKRLDILKRQSPKNITGQSLKDLNDLLSRLWSLGELKLAMKGKYDKRFIKASVDELLTTTTNTEKSSIAGLSLLHAPRVADIFDGFRKYQGKNVKLQKKINTAVSGSMVTTQNIVEQVALDVSAIKNEFTREEQAAMAFQMAVDQGLYSQAQSLVSAYAEEFGWKSEADIVVTEDMKAAINTLRGAFNETVDYLAAVYEEIENKPFIKNDNYFPIKYDRSFDKKLDIEEPTVGQMVDFSSKQVNKGFTFKRVKGVKKVLRIDIFNVFAEAVAEQQYYMRVQPVINEIANIVNDQRYQEALGKTGVEWWDLYLKGVANKGKIPNFGIWRSLDPKLRAIKINISNAVLGYKVSSALIQPTAIIDAYAYVYLNHGVIPANALILRLAGTMMLPGYASSIVKQSIGLQLRTGGELTIREMQEQPMGTKVGQAYRKGGMWLLKTMDTLTAAAVNQTMYKHFKAKGLSEGEARSEADFVTNLTQGSSEVADLPLILTSGELARTILTFQTFVLNRWGLIAHDIVRSAIGHGRIDRKLKGLIALLLISLAGGVESLLRNKATKLTTGKKFDSKFNFLQQSLLTAPETLPVVGAILTSILEYNKGFSLPITRVVENLITGAQGIIAPTGQSSKTRLNNKKKSAIKFSEALATFAGISGTAQMSDFIERALVPPEESNTKSGATKRLENRPERMKRPERTKRPSR